MGCKLFVRWFGRFLLLSAFVAQALVLGRYGSTYCGQDDLFYLIFLLVLPAIIVWICVMYTAEKQLNWQWTVWLVYITIFLVPMVGFMSRREFTKNLDKEDFFGPNVLKLTFCGAPVIAVLLLVTAKDSQDYENSIAQLCGSVALDLFDELELLELLLHPEVSLETDIQNCIIAFVCISFFLTACEMAENKFDGGKDSNSKVEVRGDGWYILRLFLQILLVNLPLLVIRLVAKEKYHIEASVFTAKNVLIIFTSSLEIVRVLSNQWNYIRTRLCR